MQTFFSIPQNCHYPIWLARYCFRQKQTYLLLFNHYFFIIFIFPGSQSQLRQPGRFSSSPCCGDGRPCRRCPDSCPSWCQCQREGTRFRQHRSTWGCEPRTVCWLHDWSPARVSLAMICFIENGTNLIGFFSQRFVVAITWRWPTPNSIVDFPFFNNCYNLW